MDKESKIQQIQILEQQFQNLLLHKQAFQMELHETRAALSELEKAGEDVFKIIGQLMIKSDREKIKQELEEKEKIINMRIKSLEKQEASLEKQLNSTRTEILNRK